MIVYIKIRKKNEICGIKNYLKENRKNEGAIIQRHLKYAISRIVTVETLFCGLVVTRML